MCRIKEIDQLLRCMRTASKVRIPVMASDPVFVYVKNYCPYSQRACLRIGKNMENCQVVDVLTGHFVDPKDITVTTCTHVPDKIKNDMRNRFSSISTTTVPQIYVYRQGWRYLGGCNDFMKIEIIRPGETRQEIQNSKDMPAVALKL